MLIDCSCDKAAPVSSMFSSIIPQSESKPNKELADDKLTSWNRLLLGSVMQSFGTGSRGFAGKSEFDVDSSLSPLQQSMAPGLGGIGTNSFEKSFLTLLAALDFKSASGSSKVDETINGDGTMQVERERLLLFSAMLMLLRRPPGLFAGLSIPLHPLFKIFLLNSLWNW